MDELFSALTSDRQLMENELSSCVRRQEVRGVHYYDLEKRFALGPGGGALGRRASHPTRLRIDLRAPGRGGERLARRSSKFTRNLHSMEEVRKVIPAKVGAKSRLRLRTFQCWCSRCLSCSGTS